MNNSNVSKIINNIIATFLITSAVISIYGKYVYVCAVHHMFHVSAYTADICSNT